MVATLESRVRITMCKFGDLKINEDKAICDINPIEAQLHAVQALELLGKAENLAGE